MIIHDLYIFRTSGRPAKAHPKRVVHSDTVLPGAIPLELFKPVAWWDTEISDSPRDL
jgi:hypothetical protein